MVCIPATTRASVPADAFNFSAAPDAMARSMDNMTTLMTAPWRAWWALTFEALDAANWR